MYSGPHTHTEGLVFGYDAGINRFNNGMPGTNITTGNNLRWTGANNATGFESNGYEETVYIPTLGNRLVRSMDIYNDYGSSGNCCPSLFEYGGWRSVSGGTVYTYQIIYYCRSGYTHPNYMYHYEYNSSGGYLTEYGVHTTGQRTHLGDGWYHAWSTFTTQATAAYINTGLWYYQYGVYDKVSVAAISIVQGSNIRPPEQLIPSNTTRSSTQSLIDLARNYSLDVSNVSFKSNGEPTFDGTNDYIDITSSTILSGTQDFTIESVYNKTGNTACAIFGNYGPGYTSNHVWFSGAYGIYIAGAVYAPGYPLANGKYHMVATRQSGAVKLYLNGALVNTGTLNTSISTNVNYRIGTDVNGVGEPFTGDIYTVRVYNQALTAQEVYNNYLAYKNRFGI